MFGPKRKKQRKAEVQCSVCGERMLVPFMLAQGNWTCKSCERGQLMNGPVDDEWNDRSLEEQDADWYMGTTDREIREMMRDL